MRTAIKAAMAVITLTTLSRASEKSATDPETRYATYLMPITEAATAMLIAAKRVILSMSAGCC